MTYRQYKFTEMKHYIDKTKTIWQITRTTDSKCRLCQQFDETVHNIISACPILAKEQYIKRHDRVCAQLQFNICKETGIKLGNEHWYEYVKKLVETNREGEVAILWNQPVQTN